MFELRNGDCAIEMQSISDCSVDCIITDPPYGVEFKNDFYDDSESTVLNEMPKWFEQWHRVLKDDCFLFIFVGVKTIHKWIECGINKGFTYKNILATRSFNNGAVSPENNFGFQFQPILVFTKGKGRKFNKVDFIPTSIEWFNDNRNKDPQPFTYQYPNWIETKWAFATAKNSIKNNHPNEKNTTLISFLIEIATNEKECVLDSFMGSGTTGESCFDTNRDFIGIELDKHYYEFSKKRISSLLRNSKKKLV